MTVVRSILVGADDLAAGPRHQGAIGRHVDAILDEPHRAVGHREIAAAGVEASEPELAQVLAGRDGDPVRRKRDRGEAGGEHGTGRVGGGIQLGTQVAPLVIRMSFGQ